MEKQKKIAGFGRQAQIILWKNLLLYSKNIVGIIFELATGLLFLAILIIILTQDETIDKRSSSASKMSVKNMYRSGVGYIYYYPKTNLTDSLMGNVFEHLKRDNKNLNGSIGTNVSSPLKLNETERNQIQAFYSFADNLSLNVTESFPDSIEYTIYFQNGYRYIFDFQLMPLFIKSKSTQLLEYF